MMESAYWKMELLRTADEIERRQGVNRWSEKQSVMLEREIMIAFFGVRSLIERCKISDELAQRPVTVQAYPKKPGQPTTRLNCDRIADLYDLPTGNTTTVSLEFLCNPLIHSYIILPTEDPQTRRFNAVFVCSDFARNSFLYLVQIEVLVSLLREVGLNYPNRLRLTYDAQRQDYHISSEFLTNPQATTIRIPGNSHSPASRNTPD